MTVIAWDGETLAADKQCTVGDTVVTVTKIFRLASGAVVAFCGHGALCGTLTRWLESGEDPAKWPAFQRDDQWVLMVVADQTGVRHYETHPYPTRYEDKALAWGIGRECALGALAMGADAVRAVEIASHHVAGCGRGVDAFKVR